MEHLLTPGEREVYKALKDGDKTINELIDILYGDREDGGPESAYNVITHHLHFIRQKTGRAITCRRIYRIES